MSFCVRLFSFHSLSNISRHLKEPVTRPASYKQHVLIMDVRFDVSNTSASSDDEDKDQAANYWLYFELCVCVLVQGFVPHLFIHLAEQKGSVLTTTLLTARGAV